MKLHFNQPAPTTVPEAIDRLISWMDENDKLEMSMLDSPESKAMTAETGLNPMGFLHFGLMREVRNGWKLWETDSPLKRWTLETYGVSMADDISGLIMDGMLAKLKGEDFDFNAKAQGYRKHWEAMDCDPATGESLKDGPDRKVFAFTGRTPSDRPNEGGHPQTAPRKRGLFRRMFDR